LFLSNLLHTSNSFGPSQIPSPRASPDSPSTALFEILSLTLYPYSLTSDEAAANLASLKFSQSNRGPDPREPSRVITTTTTTTFSMTRDMAKAMSQHFMDARLIENAADPSSNLFKDRGVYQLTPKGLHVLERFISRNGINGDHLSHVFATQPICMKLLHLERRSVDDEIIVSQSVITALFRRFVGRQANYPPQTAQALDPTAAYHERAKGIQLMDMTDRQPSSTGKSHLMTHRYCFAALAALEWLCDFSSVVGREEAAEMAAQFVRFGLITLVSDKRKNNDSAIIFTVRGSAPGGNSPVSVRGVHLSLLHSGPNFLTPFLPMFSSANG
jgi:GTPase-activating protein SST2